MSRRDALRLDTSVERLPWEAAWGRRDGPCRVFLPAALAPPASESPGQLLIM